MSSAPRTARRLARARAAGLLIACALGASGCAYSLVSAGQIRPGPFEQIVTRTARARGIAPESAVRTRVIRASELPAILRRALAADWSGAEIERYQEGLTTLQRDGASWFDTRSSYEKERTRQLYSLGFQHAGGHGTVPADWEQFLRFLEMHLKPARK